MLNASKKTNVTIELTPPFTVAELGRAYNILDRELSPDAQIEVRGNVSGKVLITAADQPTIVQDDNPAPSTTSRGRGFATPTDLRDPIMKLGDLQDQIAADAAKVLG